MDTANHVRTALTIFTGRAGDRNGRGMAGAKVVGDALGATLGLTPVRLGNSDLLPAGSWREVLAAARPDFELLVGAHDAIFRAGEVPLTTLSRCAASIATLPVVARHRPDALLVWFDAHADINVPETTSTGYLGGMVITGAAGRWDTGFGAGLNLRNVVLVGVRDIDPHEQQLIDQGIVRHVAPGKDLAQRLARAVGNRPVYVHIDCDVLEPGIVPTEYRVPGGLTLEDLRDAAEALTHNELVGLEIAEFEADWDSGTPTSPHPLLAALAPFMEKLR